MEKEKNKTGHIDISVIIVNYNTGTLLRECYASVLKHTQSATWEVIIIDNASTDDSLLQLKQDLLPSRLIENRRNEGFAKAANQGMRMAKGTYIVLLNPDTLLRDDALGKMSVFMDNDPRIGACGCALFNEDGTLQMSAHPFPHLADIFFDRTHLAYVFPKNRIFGRYQMSYWAHNEIREVDWVSGACLMVRRQLIETTGMFDERFFMFCEDIDWCLRIKKSGWKIFYFPDTAVLHYKSKSSICPVKKAPLEAWKSLVIFWKKNHGNIQAALLSEFLCADALIKAVFLALVLVLSKEKQKIKKEIGYFMQLIKVIWIALG